MRKELMYQKALITINTCDYYKCRYLQVWTEPKVEIDSVIIENLDILHSTRDINQSRNDRVEQPTRG